MYLNENKGGFPHAGRYDIRKNGRLALVAGDAVRRPHRRRHPPVRDREVPGARRQREQGLLLCPSDDVEQRLRPVRGGGYYRYSYTMNYFLEDSPYDPVTGYKVPRCGH